MSIKVFALDYSKGNPNPINYFTAAPGEAGKDFSLTPNLVAETYRQIIMGVNPIIILVCVIIAIIVAGVAAYLAYQTGDNVNKLQALLEAAKIINMPTK